MLVLLSSARSSTPVLTPALSMPTTSHHSAHHSTMPHPAHSASVLSLMFAFHRFAMGTVLFPLVGSQQGHGVVFTLDSREQTGTFRVFQLPDFRLDRTE